MEAIEHWLRAFGITQREVMIFAPGQSREYEKLEVDTDPKNYISLIHEDTLIFGR